MLNGKAASSPEVKRLALQLIVTPRRTTERTPSASITAGSAWVMSNSAIGAVHSSWTNCSQRPGDCSASVISTVSTGGASSMPSAAVSSVRW